MIRFIYGAVQGCMWFKPGDLTWVYQEAGHVKNIKPVLQYDCLLSLFSMETLLTHWWKEMDIPDFSSQVSMRRSSTIRFWLGCKWKALGTFEASFLSLIHCFVDISMCFYSLNRPCGHLDFIDHVVGNQPDDEMVSVVEWSEPATLCLTQTWILIESS